MQSQLPLAWVLIQRKMSPLTVSTRPLQEPPNTALPPSFASLVLIFGAAAIRFANLDVVRTLSNIKRRKADLRPGRCFSKLHHHSSIWAPTFGRSNKHLTLYKFAAPEQSPISSLHQREASVRNQERVVSLVSNIPLCVCKAVLLPEWHAGSRVVPPSCQPLYL